MNKHRPHGLEAETHRSLQILYELSAGASLTQRDLSERLGVALGLVNSYIRNLVAKGYVTVKSIPPRRYGYFLTPKGFSEKTRLTFHLLSDYTRVYREARENLKSLFNGLRDRGVRMVVFAGADEIAEIAYLTLQETGLKLVGVVDVENARTAFFGMDVQPIERIGEIEYDCIVVTSYLRRERIFREIRRQGVDDKKVEVTFAI